MLFQMSELYEWKPSRSRGGGGRKMKIFFFLLILLLILSVSKDLKQRELLINSASSDTSLGTASAVQYGSFRSSLQLYLSLSPASSLSEK